MKTTRLLRKGHTATLGAAVYDAKTTLMDEWHKRNLDNVVILAGDLLTTGSFPRLTP